MNTSATLASTQMVLAWTLLGVLLAWMFFCAFLAFRGRKTEQRDTADLPTPSGAFPALVPQTPLRRLSPSTDISLGGMSAVSAESASDVGAAPVA